MASLICIHNHVLAIIMVLIGSLASMQGHLLVLKLLEAFPLVPTAARQERCQSCSHASLPSDLSIVLFRDHSHTK